MTGKRAPGRPSRYSIELAAAILGRVANGEALRQICRDENMPCRDTVNAWRITLKEFSDQYARAKLAQAEALVEEIFDIADDSRNDWVDREYGKGRIVRVVDDECVQRSKLRVEARKWYASKVLPKIYGEAVLLKGDKDNPLELRTKTIVVPAKVAVQIGERMIEKKRAREQRSG